MRKHVLVILMGFDNKNICLKIGALILIPIAVKTLSAMPFYVLVHTKGKLCTRWEITN